MKYELTIYNRDVSDSDLLNDLKQVAQDQEITTKEYNIKGKYSSSTMMKRFGNWLNACEKAGVPFSRFQQTYPKRKDSSEAMLEDVKRVADLYHQNTLTVKEYLHHGKYAYATLLGRFRHLREDEPWCGILVAAGLEIKFRRRIKPEECLEALKDGWDNIGRQPTTTDVKMKKVKFSNQTYARKFNGFRKALEEFINGETAS